MQERNSQAEWLVYPPKCGTGLAASFDEILIEQVGRQLGEECRAKGAHMWLGPTLNMQRSPLGGRGFEAFSEDPVLSGTIAASIIRGVSSQRRKSIVQRAELMIAQVQSCGVTAVPKVVSIPPNDVWQS